MRKKVDIRLQIILAALPIVIAPLIAYYRIKKLRKGAIIIAVITITSYFLFSPGTSIYDAVFPDCDKFEAKCVELSYTSALILEILVNLYFVIKWSYEHNKRIGTESLNVT